MKFPAARFFLLSTCAAFSPWVTALAQEPSAPKQSPAAAAPAPAKPAPAGRAAPTPAPLVGEWFWGTVSPLRYVDRDTGSLVGHGYSGALSYEFHKDGTYRRAFYLETRLGGDASGIFSLSEGTVTFTADTFTLAPTKGTYTFTDGRKKRERPMEQDELERPGLVFTYRLEQKENGKPPVLKIGKPGEDPREFNRNRK